ncbi:MAG: tetratricopeptide repeat protein [Candidatus Electrothrix aestuarii]|uniref:Tetratricopeptide repeat protein n=1 Tax=Candidatus Electrothrix aestuarii TaxID=3062594 RepID=A0AAU8LSP3_9BACT|nr:tetratricopeptide repeat protein [Candidatus Electrothrix aestuarii]
MELIAELWHWVVEGVIWLRDHPEVTWSGAGLTALAVLSFLITKLFSFFSRKDTTPPVGNTFTHSGSGTQNVAQGNHPIAQQVNITTEQVSSPQQKAKGDHNVFSQTGDVHYEEHHHYARTAQGIPLQRPRQAEHLVGREDLLRDVLAALGPGKVVTLCGPGGIGKTALASRVAWELPPEQEAPALFPDGLLFYSFYGRKDVGLAFDHLVRSYADDGQDNSPEAATRLLANKQALIILDGAEEADDLPDVLRCCGGCGVLITSRKRSDAPGELLEVKRLDKLPAEEAFRLYSGTTADETTARAVCKGLGGWPLALRIAGQYLRNTGESAAEYLRWLEKRPFRKLGSGKHQEDNAALLLRRSMEQVSDDAVQVLRLAGVLAFAPISLEPVMAVLSEEGDDEDELELRSREALNELVLFGLLERREERWQISHALVHTYARNEEALSRDALERLARYYIWFCREQSEAGLEGYARLDGERVHCLQLIERCVDGGLWEEVKWLEDAINIYLDRQGHWTEKLAALEMNLTAARKAGDRRDEAWCLNSLGYTCWRRGENDKSIVWFEQVRPIDRELGDRKGEGVTLNNMAAIYRQQGRYEQALETYQQSLRIRQEIGDRRGEGESLNNIATVYYNQEDYEQALSSYEQCLPITREVGDAIGEGTTLNNIAEIYRTQSNYAKAIEYREQDLAICRELGDRAGEAVTCWNIGRTYEEMGDLAEAEEYITLAVEIAEQIDHPKLEEWRDGLAWVRAKRQGV